MFPIFVINRNNDDGEPNESTEYSSERNQVHLLRHERWLTGWQTYLTYHQPVETWILQFSKLFFSHLLDDASILIILLYVPSLISIILAITVVNYITHILLLSSLLLLTWLLLSFLFNRSEYINISTNMIITTIIISIPIVTIITFHCRWSQWRHHSFCVKHICYDYHSKTSTIVWSILPCS